MLQQDLCPHGPGQCALSKWAEDEGDIKQCL